MGEARTPPKPGAASQRKSWGGKGLTVFRGLRNVAALVPWESFPALLLNLLSINNLRA